MIRRCIPSRVKLVSRGSVIQYAARSSSYAATTESSVRQPNFASNIRSGSETSRHTTSVDDCKVVPWSKDELRQGRTSAGIHHASSHRTLRTCIDGASILTPAPLTRRRMVQEINPLLRLKQQGKTIGEAEDTLLRAEANLSGLPQSEMSMKGRLSGVRKQAGVNKEARRSWTKEDIEELRELYAPLHDPVQALTVRLPLEKVAARLGQTRQSIKYQMYHHHPQFGNCQQARTFTSRAASRMKAENDEVDLVRPRDHEESPARTSTSGRADEGKAGRINTRVDSTNRGSRSRSDTIAWTETEKAQLRELVQQGKDAHEIQQILPHRSLGAIETKTSIVCGRKRQQWSTYEIELLRSSRTKGMSYKQIQREYFSHRSLSAIGCAFHGSSKPSSKGKTVHWSPDELALLVQQRALGKSASKIQADHFPDRSLCSCEYQVIKLRGRDPSMTSLHPIKWMSDDEISTVRRLHSDGLTTTDIAHRMSRPYETVHAQLREQGLVVNEHLSVRKPWTPEEDKQLEHLLHGKATNIEIAKLRLDRPMPAIRRRVDYLRRRKGLSTIKSPPWTEADVAQLFEAYRQMKSPTETEHRPTLASIAKQLGRSISSIKAKLYHRSSKKHRGLILLGST